MKGYKRFVFAFILMLAIYIIAEMKRPKPVDWKITLSKEDKNPYGTYVLYRQLPDLFPEASINSYRRPVYNQLNHFRGSNTAYILIVPDLIMTEEDVEEMLNYVVTGNYVFLSSDNFSKSLTDTLGFRIMRRFNMENEDSATINFKNPSIRSKENFGFRRMVLDAYLPKFDTAQTIVLGNNQFNDVNFIKMPYGEGAFFIHALPLCFSNYFLLTRNNAEYAAKALSYLPKNINKIFWDEYYKLGPTGSRNPLRFILSNTLLKWAFWTGLITMILFVLFEMKRRQRIIPIIEPLRNSMLDFVQTVGNVYFNQHDNKDISQKKINYFLEFIRSHFNIPTGILGNEFIEALAKKTAFRRNEVNELVNLVQEVQNTDSISDETLLQLNNKIDSFYKQVR